MENAKQIKVWKLQIFHLKKSRISDLGGGFLGGFLLLRNF